MLSALEGSFSHAGRVWLNLHACHVGKPKTIPGSVYLTWQSQLVAKALVSSISVSYRWRQAGSSSDKKALECNGGKARTGSWDCLSLTFMTGHSRVITVVSDRKYVGGWGIGFYTLSMFSQAASSWSHELQITRISAMSSVLKDGVNNLSQIRNVWKKPRNQLAPPLVCSVYSYYSFPPPNKLKANHMTLWQAGFFQWTP